MGRRPDRAAGRKRTASSYDPIDFIVSQDNRSQGRRAALLFQDRKTVRELKLLQEHKEKPTKWNSVKPKRIIRAAGP